MVIILKQGIETSNESVIDKIQVQDGEKVKDEGNYCYIVYLNDEGEAATRAMIPHHNILAIF